LKTEQTNQGSKNTIDLTKIHGKYGFLCPQCGAMLHPNDEIKEGYIVKDATFSEENYLTEAWIVCNACLGNIRVLGFLALEETIKSNKDAFYFFHVKNGKLEICFF
jgi:hypothetical protein